MQEFHVKLGRYIITGEIAKGGMAHVYKGKLLGARGFEKPVAIKKILAQWDGDEEFKKLLIEEAKLLVKLNHPNIVQVIELGEDRHSPYLVMEYVHGLDLKKIIKTCRQKQIEIPLSLFFYLAKEITKGLSFAQSLRDENGKIIEVIHRDISPQNILVSMAGDVKITDFGIAKIHRENQQTQTGMIKGKFSYMSPEQARGKNVHKQTDIYALGLVLYEILTGEKAFEGQSDLEILEKARHPEIKWNKIPNQNLKKLLEKCLQIDPKNRYPHASDLLWDLESLQEKMGIRCYANDLANFLGQNFDLNITKILEDDKTKKIETHLTQLIDDTETSLKNHTVILNQTILLEPTILDDFTEIFSIPKNQKLDSSLLALLSHAENKKNENQKIKKIAGIKIKLHAKSFYNNYQVSFLTFASLFLVSLSIFISLNLSNSLETKQIKNLEKPFFSKAKKEMNMISALAATENRRQTYSSIRITTFPEDAELILDSDQGPLSLNGEFETQVDPFQSHSYRFFVKHKDYKNKSFTILIPQGESPFIKTLKLEKLKYGEIKVIARPWGQAQFKTDTKEISPSTYKILEGQQTVQVYFPPLKQSVSKTIKIAAGSKITCRASFKRRGSFLSCR